MSQTNATTETYWTSDGMSVTPTELCAIYRDSGHLIVALLREGWTVDGAINHVEGLCDVTLCTHPDHAERTD